MNENCISSSFIALFNWTQPLTDTFPWHHLIPSVPIYTSCDYTMSIRYFHLFQWSPPCSVWNMAIHKMIHIFFCVPPIISILLTQLDRDLQEKVQNSQESSPPRIIYSQLPKRKKNQQPRRTVAVEKLGHTESEERGLRRLAHAQNADERTNVRDSSRSAVCVFLAADSDQPGWGKSCRTHTNSPNYVQAARRGTMQPTMSVMHGKTAHKETVEVFKYSNIHFELAETCLF